MLSIARMARGQGDYYQRLASEDYYLHGGEPPGYWWGRGAQALQFAGQVLAGPFAQLLEGFGPDGAPLVNNAGRPNRRPGFDLCLSAPKSVSIVWAVADEATRTEVRRAHAASVEAALSYLQNQSVIRRGHRGIERVPAGLVVALFEHSTSRAVDPQLHTHALVMNAAVAEDGRFGALDAHRFYELKMTVGALYRAELAAQLEQRLGLECETRRTWFELKGVPDSLIEEFSKRRAAIEQALAATGLETASAAAVATLKTRPIKELVPPRTVLFAKWQETSRLHGFTAEVIAQLLGRHHPQEREPSQLVREAASKLGVEQGHFSEPEVTAHVAAHSIPHSPGAARIAAAGREEFRKSPDFVPVGERDGFLRFTTQALQQAARATVDAALLLAGFRHGVPKPIVEGIIASLSERRSFVGEALRHQARQLARATKKRKPVAVKVKDLRGAARLTLDIDHAEKVRHLTHIGRGNIRCVEAPDEAQRYVMLRAVREAYEKGGYRVIGVTPSRSGVERLKHRAGFADAKTLRGMDAWMRPSLAYHARHAVKQIARTAVGLKAKKLQPFRARGRTVVVVDDAEWLNTRRFEQLVKNAHQNKGLVIFTGFKRTTRMQPRLPIQILFEQLSRVMGGKPQQEQSVSANSHEPPKANVLQRIAQQNRVTITPTLSSAEEALFAAWRERELRQSSRRSVIICGSEQKATALNKRCQQARKEAMYGSRSGVQTSNGEFFTGDPVRFSSSSRPLGIRKDVVGTIVGVKPERGTVTVVYDDTTPPRTVPVRDRTDVHLAYAVSHQFAEARATADTAYVLLDADMPTALLTRINETPRVFLDERRACLEGLAFSRERDRDHEADQAQRQSRARQEERLDREQQRTRR